MSTQPGPTSNIPTTTSTSRTVGQPQQNAISAPVSLPTCLVPTGTIGINATNMATTSMEVGPSNMFAQRYNGPFTYGMQLGHPPQLLPRCQ